LLKQVSISRRSGGIFSYMTYHIADGYIRMVKRYGIHVVAAEAHCSLGTPVVTAETADAMI